MIHFENPKTGTEAYRVTTPGHVLTVSLEKTVHHVSYKFELRNTAGSLNAWEEYRKLPSAKYPEPVEELLRLFGVGLAHLVAVSNHYIDSAEELEKLQGRGCETFKKWLLRKRDSK